MKSSVVIGANYGDEGKGLITDYLSGARSLVVRSNGGAQAGHTVVTPGGQKHIFSHIGSGSFQGAPTFLSRFFVMNPMLFSREHIALSQFNLDLKVYVDERAPITTPYDMIVNQRVERARGKRRHGSCGVGFHETLLRSSASQDQNLTFGDLKSRSRTEMKLDACREYFDSRLYQLDLDRPVGPEYDEIEKRFRQDLFFMKSMCQPVLWEELMKDWQGELRNVVFEGAQGLKLDMDHKDFPHVTCSKTGVHNPTILASEAGIESLEVIYVTRTYLTRHGQGPFLESNPRPYEKANCETNVQNEYQGGLRYGYLDMVDLVNEIDSDLRKRPLGIPVDVKLALTHTDQIDDGKMRYWLKDGAIEESTPQEFLAHIADTTEIKKFLRSYGPTRKHICEEPEWV